MREMLPLPVVVHHRLHLPMARLVRSAARTLKGHSIHRILPALHRGIVILKIGIHNALSSVREIVHPIPHSLISVHFNHRMRQRNVLHARLILTAAQGLRMVQCQPTLGHRMRPEPVHVLTLLAVHSIEEGQRVRRPAHKEETMVRVRGLIRVHAQEHQHHVHRNDARRSRRNQLAPSPFLLRLWSKI